MSYNDIDRQYLANKKTCIPCVSQNLSDQIKSAKKEHIRGTNVKYKNGAQKSPTLVLVRKSAKE